MAKRNSRARVDAGTQPKADPEGRPPAGLGSCVVDLANTLARGTANLMARHGLIPLDLAVLRLFLTKGERMTSQLAEMLPVNASRMSGQVARIVGMGLTSRPTPALPPAAGGPVAAGGSAQCPVTIDGVTVTRFLGEEAGAWASTGW